MDVELSNGLICPETFSNGPIARDLGNNVLKNAWLKDDPSAVVSVTDGSVTSYAYHKGFHANLLYESIRDFQE